MMQDLISRQAAIDVADAVWSVTGDKNVAKVWDQIKDLPSVQPKSANELAEKVQNAPNDDFISRKAAIAEIARWIGYIDEDMIGRIQTGLKRLPSAQPEIIRCKDCEYWREDHTCREHSLVSPMAANEFCSRAERREK